MSHKRKIENEKSIQSLDNNIEDFLKEFHLNEEDTTDEELSDFELQSGSDDGENIDDKIKALLTDEENDVGSGSEAESIDEEASDDTDDEEEIEADDEEEVEAEDEEEVEADDEEEAEAVDEEEAETDDEEEVEADDVEDDEVADDEQIVEADDTEELEAAKDDKTIGDGIIDNVKSKKGHSTNNNNLDSEMKITSSKNNNSIKGNEYEEDSSDEEDLRNTIGNIPINWYDEFEHLGYDLDANQILKPDFGDKLDKFLADHENPDNYRTVIDKLTGQDVVLSDADLDFVNRVMKHKVPDSSYNLYEPFPDLYSHEQMIMPLSGRHEHKRSFLPPMAERKKVAMLALLMKKGLYNRRRRKGKKTPRHYDIWTSRKEDDPRVRRISRPIPPPKFELPSHHSSYNPPPEYLVNKKDVKALKGLSDEEHQMYQFFRKYKTVREIPMYKNTIINCFSRLLNLNTCPRKTYQRVIAKAKDFLPDLPDKKDLRPYPTMTELIFKGHQSIIRTISIHPNGKYLASGSDDHSVKIWEISNARCLRTFDMDEPIMKVAWNPNPKLFLLAVALGRLVVFLCPESYLTDKLVVNQTNAIFREEVDQGDYIVPERITAAVTWRKPTVEEWDKGFRLVVEHFKEIKSIVWHKQGDYFSTVIPDGQHRSVLIHQLSRWRSQVPFSKSKGRVQAVAFHPKQAHIFVVTQTHIRVYDLHKTRLVKKIQSNCRYISCIEVHPGGEHFIIGGFDRRTNWFEMEYTKRPHLMRYHCGAVRAIKFHRKYPMFASCSDDGRIVITHSTVYDDWLKDPLIVPLKSVKGHRRFNDYVALDLAWHPYEPYLLSAGADATIRLWN